MEFPITVKRLYLIPYFEKLGKMIHLLSISMFLLSQKNREAIDDGTEGGQDKYLLHL